MDIQFAITSPNNCDHWHVTASAGKKQRSFVFLKQDLVDEVERVNDLDQLTEDQVKNLLRGAAKKDSLTTLAQVKIAVEGKEHKL